MNNPALEATTAFEVLQRRYPGSFEEGQLRSLQRRFRRWKLTHGHDRKPVYFEQEHEPGRMLQLDWFHPRDFEVRIAGEAYRHLINSSTATHHLGKGSRRRDFNERFVGLLSHYGMQPKTIQVGAANENGDVESSHSHLRRYLTDNLGLRPQGADFDTLEEYEQWLRQCLKHRNQLRSKRIKEETAVLRSLPGSRLPEYEEVDCHPNKYSLVRVGKGSYSVPPRHRGQRLRARVYESRIELWNGNEPVASFESHANAGGAYIDWRHLIEDLCRKPGAFERYRYRHSFYPSPLWQRLGESLRERFSTVRAHSDYLQILRLSLEHGMERIEELLGRIDPREVSLDRIRAELGQQGRWREAIAPVRIEADLDAYDRLLSDAKEEVAHG